MNAARVDDRMRIGDYVFCFNLCLFCSCVTPMLHFVSQKIVCTVFLPLSLTHTHTLTHCARTGEDGFLQQTSACVSIIQRGARSTSAFQNAESKDTEPWGDMREQNIKA